MDLHFKYTVYGKGFDDAKTDFIIRVSNNKKSNKSSQNHSQY